MTNIKRNIKNLVFALILFLFSSLNVYAGSAKLSINGATSVIVGNNVEVVVNINNIKVTDGVAGFEAKVNYDSNYLEFVSKSNMASFFISYTDSVKMISGAALDVDSRITSSSSNLIKLVFKTKKVGKTTISLSGTEVSEGNTAIASSNNPSKMISITPPPSSNANLASLGLSSGTLNFNKNTTSYNVKVDSGVTSINVSASTEDKGAKVSGIGTKNLNYGDNKINVVVTAEDGTKKTYTMTVNREDNRSSNNNLASIKLSTGTLSSSFNRSRTIYNVSVPFDVSSIKVDAVAEDARAKVVISGGSYLRAGAVSNVTIKVTAENGAAKTYTVKVTRGKDPNQQDEKNKNNNLASLSLGDDINLNPKFNKNVVSYKLEVPYKKKALEIEAIAEDEAFAKVNIIGANNLQVGENEVKIVVTAEDGTPKEYVLKVTRLEGTKEEIANDKPINEIVEENIPHLLKSVNIANGKLVSKFDSKKFVYYYKKNKDFKIEGIPNDEGDKVTVYEHDNVITIVVGENLEDAHVYTFIPKEVNSLAIVISICSIILLGTGIFFGYKRGTKSSKKTRKIKSKN